MIEADAGDAADCVRFAGRNKRQALADQNGIDRGIARALPGDHAAMEEQAERLVGAEEVGHLRELDLAALLEILQGAAADRERLRGTRLVEAVEEAGNVTGPDDRRH